MKKKFKQPTAHQIAAECKRMRPDWVQEFPNEFRNVATFLKNTEGYVFKTAKAGARAVFNFIGY